MAGMHIAASIGYNISQSGMPIQLVWIGQAMQDVRDGKAKMTEDEVNQYLQYYFMVKRPAENAAASKAWLEKTEKKSGVKKTESGLLYKVTKEGDAAKMAKDPRDVVRVHYTGYTREGKVFDTSIFKNRSKEQQEMMRKQSPDSFDEKGAPKEADEPAKFPLNRVIKGWTEGLQLVGEGGKITLWIPSDLAYGTRGAGRDIGPNEALQFDVEVIEVIPYEEPAPADSTATAPAPAPAPAPVEEQNGRVVLTVEGAVYEMHQESARYIVTADSDTATLFGSLGNLAELKAQGVDTLVFRTKSRETALDIDTMLSLGTEDTIFTLTHSGSSATLTVGGADHNELIH